MDIEIDSSLAMTPQMGEMIAGESKILTFLEHRQSSVYENRKMYQDLGNYLNTEVVVKHLGRPSRTVMCKSLFQTEGSIGNKDEYCEALKNAVRMIGVSTCDS